MDKRLSIKIGALTCLAASNVHATGLGFWESSTSISALGGANGASAVDASALAINPSSIAQLESATVTVAASHYKVDTSYEFVDGLLGVDYSTAEVIPAGFFTLPLHQNWDLGLAIYSRNAADITVPSFIPFRDTEPTNLAPIMVSVAPSLVYSRDNWSLGITAEYIHSQYSLEYTTCGVFKCNQISVLDETSGWSGAISGTLQVNSQLSLAGAYKFATEFGDQNIDIQLPSVASLFATYHANPNLNIHLSYSYSEWKNKGVRYADYDDPIGLLVGANDSHRLATSLEYHLGCAMMMLGMSADQAIDAFGGNDIRLRAGLGYNFGDHWRIDGVVVSENYAEKVGEASGITFVSVQNEGMLLGLGVNYQF